MKNLFKSNSGQTAICKSLAKGSFLIPFLCLFLVGLSPAMAQNGINPDAGNILYINQDVSGGNESGNSWANAIPELRDALAWAQDWDAGEDGTLQIWVAAGTYLPTDDDSDRDATFQMVNGVEIYGGFAGEESSIGARNWDDNPTILSGDIDQSGNLTGNSYSVVTGSGTNASAVIDGFTITMGNADVATGDNNNFNRSGGGMYNSGGSPTVTNCTFSGNNAWNGGGMANLANSNPTVTNSTFSENSANSGGGMYSNESTPTVTNCTFSGNNATQFGGGMSNLANSNPTVTNSIFLGNTAGGFGGGMYNESSTPKVTNSIFSGNTAGNGGGMSNYDNSNPVVTNSTFSGNSAFVGGGIANDTGSSSTLTNCIIWNNTATLQPSSSASVENGLGSTSTFSHCLIANSGGSGDDWESSLGTDGGGNIDANPFFVDPGDPAGLRLLAFSPAINAGNPDTDLSLFPTDASNTPIDLAGNPRVFPDNMERIDMGAYENEGIQPDGNILYVDQNVNTGVSGYTGAGNSWANAVPELRYALPWTGANWESEDGTLQIWVAQGIYTPVEPNDPDNVTNAERAATFQLVNNVAIYGGFAGEESSIGTRNWDDNPTILSGDIDGSGTLAGNSYSVVTGSGTNATAVIDGFTITGGNADVTSGNFSPDRTGGGMYNNVGSPTVANCTFSGNLANWGGGMFNESSSPSVTNCTFSENIANISGGGMINLSSSSPMVENSTFSGNSAAHGGGIFNQSSSPTLSNVTFSSNSATSTYGGGMNNSSESNPNLANVTFTGNSAFLGGGGLANQSSSPVVVNSTFSGNTANDGQRGGGMYNGNSSPTVTNSLFLNNSQDGMYNETSSNPKVTNSVFRGNGFNGIYNLSSSPTVTNSIIWGNTSGGIFDDSSTPTITYSIVQDGYTGTGNLNSDPLFVDTAGGDYSLMNTSPAINAGDPNTDLSLFPGGPDNPFDLAGNPRVFDGLIQIIDMGAYEFQGEPILKPEPIVLTAPADEAENVTLQPLFEWETEENADTYTLQVSSDDEFEILVIHEDDLEEKTFQAGVDLENATTYYWRVLGTSAAGDGEWSEVWSFTTVPEASEVVILLTPANEAMDVVLTPELIWNPATGADTYELQLSENADFTDPVIDEGGLEETNFQINTALEVSTQYYWQVRGVNPGGPGEWSEPFTFTTRALPEAGDGRVLVSNQSSLYIFSGADFGLTDAAYSIRIESVSGGGTLSVDADDQLTISQINSDALTYKPAPGQHGYGFAAFEFTVLDDAGLESEQTYTMSIDLAATSVTLTEGKGWRFLTSPSMGDTFQGFLSPITVQGVPGSANPGARDASLYILNQEEYQWELPDAMSDEIDPGKGFIVFGFEDDMPTTLTSGQNWLPLDGEYGYEGLFYDPDQGPEGNSHFLLANPHPISLDFCAFFAQDVAENIQFWDPSFNEGDYRTLSCFNGGAEIAPFQAFWIRTLDSGPQLQKTANLSLDDPSLGIPEAAYLGAPVEGTFKQTPNEDLFSISLNLTEDREGFTNDVQILFTEEGTMGMDAWDAPKLSAAGLAQRWLNFHAMDEDQKSYAIRSLPANFGDQITIPLGIETTQAGGYTLSWELPHRSVFGGSYFLRDIQTGAITELSEGQTYRFDVENSYTTKVVDSPLLREAARGVSFMSRANDASTPRFELLVAQAGVDGFTGLGDLPSQITLNQNYPNPFNPTTIISYELPQTEQVRLDVYDMTGRQVATLVNGQVAAGRHQVSFNAMNLSSGVYMYRLQAGGTMLTRQLTLIK